ncbi:TKL kinase [Chlorella sorokiniana]|uniref:TKL kinase n=1 Tax=Chlorella sorokiniana TaxID=3076 RepID=A0A2P6TYK3_CHLSO|nr:TKL kinase [Chlorella sorokiniana]|eukprot:PRW59146.1 TKL kinase [Chlorella sorokiniana]
MHYFLEGTLLESDGTSPCVGCTETGGCATCKAGSFKTPDSYSMSQFKLPSMPIQCETCGVCALNKCIGTVGCQTCDVDEKNKPYPKMKVPNAAATGADLDVCIADLCLDYDYEFIAGGNVDAADRNIYPSNINFYSNALNCKRQATADTTSMLCTNQAGCTACKAGHFLTPNPIVPGTAMCMPCDGCPNSQCKANGCAACPNAVLKNLVRHPWGITGMNRKAAMVCRNATNGVTPFKSRTGLLSSSVWPAPEFGACPARLGDFKINWWQVDDESDITVAKWSSKMEGSSVPFQSNDTVKIVFDAVNNQRVKVTLQYKDKTTLKPVTSTIWGVFPLSQTRVCVALDNNIAYNDANGGMQMQLYFNTPPTWNKRFLLRMTGEPSLTVPLQGYKYGKVTVFAKRAADTKYTLAASLDTGINWKAADLAKLVIYPEEDEWPALVAKAGTL